MLPLGTTDPWNKKPCFWPANQANQANQCSSTKIWSFFQFSWASVRYPKNVWVQSIARWRIETWNVWLHCATNTTRQCNSAKNEPVLLSSWYLPPWRTARLKSLASATTPFFQLPQVWWRCWPNSSRALVTLEVRTGKGLCWKMMWTYMLCPHRSWNPPAQLLYAGSRGVWTSA